MYPLGGVTEHDFPAAKEGRLGTTGNEYTTEPGGRYERLSEPMSALLARTYAEQENGRLLRPFHNGLLLPFFPEDSLL